MERTRLPDYRILTNDPSFTAWGWAVMDNNGNIIESGCIKTAPEQKKRRIRKGDDTVRRVSEINKQLLGIFEKYGCGYIISELPHGSQNASAARMIGIVIGIIQTLGDALNIGVEWYSEGDAKKCALNKQSCTKDEMIKAMLKIYGNKWATGVKYIDEAIADALAIHYVASKQSAMLKLIRG